MSSERKLRAYRNRHVSKVILVNVSLDTTADEHAAYSTIEVAFKIPNNSLIAAFWV